MQHFNPATFWMSQAVACARLMQVQQEFMLRMLAAYGSAVPHQSAAELAAEAEAMKAICGDPDGDSAGPRPMKPAAKPAAKGAGG